MVVFDSSSGGVERCQTRPHIFVTVAHDDDAIFYSMSTVL